MALIETWTVHQIAFHAIVFEVLVSFGSSWIMYVQLLNCLCKYNSILVCDIFWSNVSVVKKTLRYKYESEWLFGENGSKDLGRIQIIPVHIQLFISLCVVQSRLFFSWENKPKICLFTPPFFPTLLQPFPLLSRTEKYPKLFPNNFDFYPSIFFPSSHMTQARVILI